MFKNIFLFELKYWSKRPITYIFPLILFALSMLVFTAENVQLGGEAVYRNSPYALINVYWILFMISPLLMNAIVCSGITRDYEYNSHQIIYSMPVRRLSLLLGRFMGGVTVIFMMFGVVILADIVAPLMPWIGEDYLSSLNFGAHLYILLTLILPNILILGSILYVIAAMSKSTQISLLAAMAFVVLYMGLLSLLSNLNNKDFPAFIDPMGGIAINLQTEKWTLYQKNNDLYRIDYRLIINRLIWIAVALISWWAAYRYSRLNRTIWSKNKKTQSTPHVKPHIPEAKVGPIDVDSRKYFWNTLIESSLLEYRTMLQSPVFYTVVGLSGMILVMNIISMIQNDHIESIANSLEAFEFSMGILQPIKFGLIFLVGNLVWKSRENHFSDVLDALPSSTAHTIASQLLAVVWYILTMLAMMTLIAIGYQVFGGYTTIDWWLYLVGLWMSNIVSMSGLAVLSMLIQVMVRSKFLGYLLSVMVVFFESYILSWLEIQSNLVGLTAKIPIAVYSEFYGYGPYLKAKLWFMLYWLLLFAILGGIAYLFYPRGRETQLYRRSRVAYRLLVSKWPIFAVLILSWGGVLGYLAYQTMVVNPYLTTEESYEQQAHYEKTYKPFDTMPIPVVVHADYDIDLYPSRRQYRVKGKLQMVNQTDRTIAELMLHHATKFRFEYDSSIGVSRGIDLKAPNPVEFIKLNEPLLPGDTIDFVYQYAEQYSGIENEIENQRLMPNGTFLDHSSFTPTFGYSRKMEISEKSKREKYKLPVNPDYMPPLEHNCGQKCMVNYLGKDASWATVSSRITTESDQIAVAPGVLVNRKAHGERVTYEYELAQPSVFFFSIVSGRYSVARDSAQGVACEVYYTPNHHHNVSEMMKALKLSIEYYSSSFGPYRLPVARIIEFPGFSSFAQAFPGTMPYSESIGFTSNLSESPYDINEIFHVVAHEMAHQWWAHQVIGAYMQGATLLSESLAEYSSLKLLQKVYGDDMIAKFLKDANFSYTLSRSSEAKKESSLLEVDNQAYVHYQKGSIILYGIQQLLGESRFNGVLKQLIAQYAYRPAPYPTSSVYYNLLMAAAPDSLHKHIKQGLEDIIVWQNDLTDATTIKRSDSLYETTVKFKLQKWQSDPKAKQTKKNKDNQIGLEKSAPIDDYYDITLFTKGHDKLRYGIPIASIRKRLSGADHTIKIVSKAKPDLVALDPNFLHIHKDPELNIKRIKSYQIK